MNGTSGDVRALPTRAFPVMSLILAVARTGLGSRDLLDVLAGSLVSIFSFRRRLLSKLDLVYTEGRGLPRRQIFRFSDGLRDELVTSALLVPVAATNLRSRPSPWLLATDPSMEWEAEVRTVIRRQAGLHEEGLPGLIQRGGSRYLKACGHLGLDLRAQAGRLGGLAGTFYAVSGVYEHVESSPAPGEVNCVPARLA